MIMKPNFKLLAVLTTMSLQATLSGATLYWDGTTSSVNADGGTGTWINGSTLNWDTFAFSGSDSVWTNGAHTAVFGGAAATVTIGTGGVTVGGLTFNSNSYILAAGTNGLNFSSGNNVIQSFIGNNGNTASTITGLVGGTGANFILSSSADQRIFNLTFSGISAGGWTGSTTINAGTTLTTTTTSGNINQVLNSTSGITLNGGTIQFNRATNAQLNAISDSAAINVYGGGTFSANSADGGGASANETIGVVTHNSGMLNLNWINNPSSGGNIILSGFDRVGTASTLAVSFGAAGRFINSAVSTNTATNEIIGAWATTGGQAGINAQTDYAVYSGGNGTITARGIAASAQSTWSTTHSSTSNYTLNNNSVLAAANGRLTASRNINTLRSLTNTAAPSVVDATTDYITMVGNDLQDGDVVVSRNTTGGQLTPGRAYYVINAGGAGAGTFQVSTTPGGSAVNLTTAATGFVGAGVNLNGNTLGTTGILNGSSDPMAIGGGSGSSVTLPTTTSGNLYVTNGNASIWIDVPITDNGAGVLTLVKSGTSTNGSGDVTLAGANTYTGGTVINSGALTFFTNNSWVSGQNITFGGAGRINASVGALSGGTLDIDQGAVGVISGSSAITFSTTTGSGKLNYYGGGVGGGVLNMGDASGFTGDLHISNAGGTNPYPSVTFASIGDTAGSSIQFGGGQGDGNQRVIVAYDGASAMTLENRQVQILPRSLGNNAPRRNVLMNNSTNADHKLVIEQNLLNTVDRTGVEFQLDGSNAGNNEFAGNIGNSTYSAVTNPSEFALNVYKNGAGKWILSGDNTFTGRLLISRGTLSVGTFNDSDTAGALGMGTVIQLGGAEASPVTGGSGLASAMVLSGSNSGTLEYTGGAATTSRTFQIGSNATGTHTGGGAIANNGSGALTFTAANFNDTIAGVSATRTLTLTGSNAGNNEIQGIIRDNVASTGKINLTKSGTGIWKLSGANTYSGTTSIDEGILTFSNKAAKSSNSTVTAAAAGTIGLGVGGDGVADYSDADVATLFNDGQLGGATGLNLNAASGVAIDTTTGNFTQSTSLTASRALTKLGINTLTLTGSHTYTGATSVTGGTLNIASGASLAAGSAVSVTNNSTIIVNGTIGGTLNAATGTTVYGSGTVTGAATIAGNHNPGNSPGIQTFDSDLTYSGGSSTVQWELNADAILNSPVVFDQIIVNGDLDFAGLTTLNLVFNGSGSTVDWNDALWTSNQSWTIYDVAGTTTNFGNLQLTTINWLDGSGLAYSSSDNAGGSFALGQNGQDVVLNYTAPVVIPEPKAVLLGAIGLLLLFRRRR